MIGHANACERCVQREFEQLRRQQMAIEELRNLSSPGDMLRPEYFEWLLTPGRSYTPVDPRRVPRGWEGIERNRIIIDNTLGPNSPVGRMIERMNRDWSSP